MRHPAARWSLLALGYLALALVLTWPLGLGLGDHLLGTPTMDQVDTAWLRLAAARWLTGQEPGIFAPVGYPLEQVIPNWMDHVLGAPFALLLPWPLADNAWWLLVLAANGLAGHVLGRQVGGTHAAGALCGVALACCEPVLREVNASHAPQAMVFWAPLFLAALLRALEPDGRIRHALLAGLLLALSALTYWYQGLFLSVLALPVVLAVLAERRRAGGLRPVLLRLALAGGTCAAICAVPLALALQAAPDLAGLQSELARRVPGVPGSLGGSEHAWAFLHGSGPGWPFSAEPVARSNRLSLALLAAALWGAWRLPSRRWAWLAAAALGGLLLMGPYLQLQGEPVLVGGRAVPLPGLLLAELSAVFARLHWPARWGIVVPLALLPLAARAPRPWLWAPVVLVEALVLSGNAPVATSPVGQFAGWAGLERAPGPVLVLPQEIQADGPSSMGLIFRAARCPLANELGVPPRASQPRAFRDWHERLALRGWWRFLRADGGVQPPPDGAWEQLERAGVAAVALDVTPGGFLSPEENHDLAERMSASLGLPDDYGAALVWWIRPPSRPVPSWEDAPAWRREEHLRLQTAGFRRARSWPEHGGGSPSR